ncbi:MAG: hypothetical protein ABS876_02760 [Ruminococcus sp.]
MYSLPICALNKNGLMEIFETLSHFSFQIMIKNGDYIVDAHSLIGVFSLDIRKPIELLLSSEPDETFKEAVAPFTLATVSQ